MSDRLDQLTAVILVGGLGTRLRAVVPDKQKVVASVAGKPFLFQLLDQVAAAELKQVVLCTGYRGDEVAAAIGNNYRGLAIQYSPETQPLGTAGAIRQALPLLDSDPVLAMNGDSFCDADLPAFWQSHLTRKAQASLVVMRADDTRDRGRIDFDATGAITSFVEKGATSGPGWINAGIYLLTQAVLNSIPAGRPVSIERETFPGWVGRGLYACETSGRFLDIGTPESYARAQEFFR